MSTSSRIGVLVLLSLSCSSNESPREMEPPPTVRADAARPDSQNRAVRVTVELQVRSAEPGFAVLATRAGSVDVALPYFDAALPRKAVVPVELEGGIPVCLTIDTLYAGSPADTIGLTVKRRLELRGAHSSFESDSFGAAVDGSANWGTDLTVAWDPEVLVRFVVTAAPGPADAPAVAFLPRDAKDPCVEKLRPRVIASLKDL
jgi:hypothetical protein